MPSDACAELSAAYEVIAFLLGVLLPIAVLLLIRYLSSDPY